MKQYEKELKQLITQSNGGCDPVHQRATGLSEEQLRFLSAKGLIELRPAGNNEFWVTIAPRGLAHFSDKSETWEKFIKEHIISFLFGFAAGVLTTLAGAWLLQLLP